MEYNKTFPSTGNRNGFTIMETLIVIFIGTLLIMGILALYDWHSRTYNFQEAQVRTSESGRNTIQTMLNFTSHAYRVLSSGSVNGTTYSSNATTLVLQLPAVDSSGTVLGAKWDYVAFYVSGGKLFYTLEKDPSSSRVSGTKILSDTLYSISFTYDDVDFTQVRQVSVDLQTQVTVRDSNVSNRLQQELYLKNYY